MSPIIHEVVENAADCVHITLPAVPAGAGDLSDDELSNAAADTQNDGCVPINWD